VEEFTRSFSNAFRPQTANRNPGESCVSTQITCVGIGMKITE